MAQFLRPSSDITLGSWTTSPLFEKVDEISASDADFIQCPNNSNTTCDLGLSTASTPQAGTRTLRIRARKGASGGNTRGLNYNLKQGGTSVQSGTVNAALTEVYSTVSITITGSITDYSNLSLELSSTGTTGGAGGNRRTVEVSWAEFEIPDAPPSYNLSGGSTGLLGTSSGNATFEAPAIDRNLSGGSTGLLGTSSGNATNEVPIFNLSGSSAGLLGTSSGNATNEIPVYSLSGGSTGLLGTSSGNATNEVPIYNLSGSSAGLLGTSSGNINTGAPSFELAGGSTGLLGTSSGNATNEVPVYSLSGGSTGLLGTSSGNATNEIPVYSLSGGSTGLLGTSSGNATNEIPVYSLSGSSAGLLGVSSGTINTGSPVFELSGGSTGLLGTSSGNATNELPTRSLSGASVGLLGVSSGTINTGSPVFELTGSSVGLLGTSSGNATNELPTRSLSGASTGLLGISSGELTNEVPNFNLSGSVNGLLGVSSGNLLTTDSSQYVISGGSVGLLGVSSGGIYVPPDDFYDLGGIMIYRQPTNLPTVTYPLGVDASIQALQTELGNELGWLRYSFGRAFLGRDDIKGKADYLYPAVYKGEGNYQDVSPNDNVVSQSFFYINGDYNYINYEINEQNNFTLPVSLIVWGDLKKIAPSVDEHLGQVLLQDMLRVIRKNNDFKIDSIKDNDPSVFDEFSVSSEHTKLFYYPYFCFRIDMDLAVKEDCEEDIDSALNSYDILDNNT